MDNLILSLFGALVMSYYINLYQGINTPKEPTQETQVVWEYRPWNHQKPTRAESYYDSMQIECLADNIFHESKGESLSGQKAVGFVTMNRANNPHFPETICEVVTQRTRRVCQFSWYCDSKKFQQSKQTLLTKLENPVYNSIHRLAMKIYYNYQELTDPTEGALFFHANYVRPNWKGMTHTATIGNHIFYTKLAILN